MDRQILGSTTPATVPTSTIPTITSPISRRSQEAPITGPSTSSTSTRPDNILEFQKLYNQNISAPNLPLVEDAKWGPKTAQAYENYLQTKQLNREIGLPFTTIPSAREPLSSGVRSQNPIPSENQPSSSAASTDTLSASATPSKYRTP